MSTNDADALTVDVLINHGIGTKETDTAIGQAGFEIHVPRTLAFPDIGNMRDGSLCILTIQAHCPDFVGL